jgi:hypothetical protein
VGRVKPEAAAQDDTHLGGQFVGETALPKGVEQDPVPFILTDKNVTKQSKSSVAPLTKGL